MVKHRKQGKLDDFEAKRSKLYDIRFDDGSIIINVEEGCLTKRYPKQQDKRLPKSSKNQNVTTHWVRVGDVVLCEKGLGIIRFSGTLPGSKGVWMGMELKDDETLVANMTSTMSSPELKTLYFLGTPVGFCDEMVVERDVLQCHNGYYRGRWYYDCPRGMGYWLRDKDIQKVYAPEEVLMQLGWLNLRIEEMEIELTRRKKMSRTRTARPAVRQRVKAVKSPKNKLKPCQYGALSLNKPHTRTKSALELNYKKNARNRMELVSNYVNEDQAFLQLFKKELDVKPVRT